MNLKSCPFCGSTVRTQNLTGYPILFIKCSNLKCGAVISFNNKETHKHPEKALKYFDRRVEWG